MGIAKQIRRIEIWAVSLSVGKQATWVDLDSLLAPSVTADSRALSGQRPREDQREATRFFVASSIKISSGHGRVNPSVSHLRVASMPILEP